MGYAVELLFNVVNMGDRVTLLSTRKKIASSYGCEHQYFVHELEGNGRKIKNCNSIQIIEFNENNFEGFLNFMKYINRDKSVIIDCIYSDISSCDLLYASPNYIKRLNKKDCKKIKTDLYKKQQTELGKQILKIIKKNKIK